MRKDNVVIIPAKCQRTGSMYGIRAEKTGGAWHLNWSFPMPEDESARENFNENKISGKIVIDQEYPGCPHCGGKGFVHCGQCGKLSCWDEEDKNFTCHHCGYEGQIGGSAEEFGEIKVGDY